MKTKIHLSLLIIFLVSIVFLSTAHAQIDYFDKPLDEYKPHFIADIVPQELLKFQTHTTQGTVTKIAFGNNGYSNKFDKTTSPDIPITLNFWIKINSKDLKLSYMQILKEDIKREATLYKYPEIDPKIKVYSTILSRVSWPCSQKNLKNIETNLPDEYTVCGVVFDSAKLQIPNYSDFFYYILFDQDKKIYQAEFSYKNILISIETNDLELLKKTAQSALTKLRGKQTTLSTKIEKKSTMKQEPLPFFDKDPDEYTPTLVPDIIVKNMAYYTSGKPRKKKSGYNNSISETHYNIFITNASGNSTETTIIYYRYPNTIDPNEEKNDPLPKDNRLISQTKSYIFLLQQIHRYFCEYKKQPNEVNIPSQHIEELKKCSYEPQRISYYLLRDRLGIPSEAYAIFDDGGTFVYGNIVVSIISRNLDSQTTKAIGQQALNSLKNSNQKKDQPKVFEPKKEEIKLRSYALPSAYGDKYNRTAYIPASTQLPAKIVVETNPNTPVTIEMIKNKDDAYLTTGELRSDRLIVTSNSNGIAEVYFYYKGKKVDKPLKYEIKVSAGDEREIIDINVGLNIAFEKVKAVKGDVVNNIYPFTLTVKSKNFPKLPLGIYLSNASEHVWNGKTVGIKLNPKWINKPANLPPDKVFQGIVKPTTTVNNENLLTVLSDYSGGARYFLTNYDYPAVIMMSQGAHTYQIQAELVVADKDGKEIGKLQEDIETPEAFIVVTRDDPEKWITSVTCSLEATTSNQFLAMVILEEVPVFGDYFELLTTVTGSLCNIMRGEYDNMIKDLAKYLGEKFLDRLTKKDIFDRLPKSLQDQVLTLRGGYKVYDYTDKYQKYRELREKESSPQQNIIQNPAPQNFPTHSDINLDILNLD